VRFCKVIFDIFGIETNSEGIFSVSGWNVVTRAWERVWRITFDEAQIVSGSVASVPLGSSFVLLHPCLSLHTLNGISLTEKISLTYHSQTAKD